MLLCSKGRLGGSGIPNKLSAVETPVSSQVAWSRVTSAPAASWTQLVAYLPTPDSDQPVAWLLHDQQVRFGDTTERYIRIVGRALADLGVDWLSERRVTFNPSYQTIVIHQLSIARGDDVIDARVDAEEDLVRVEPDMHARVYRGDYTLVIQIRGLEIGDILDFAYTIIGAHPALSPRPELEVEFAFRVNIGRHHSRILVRNDLPAHWHVFGAPPVPVLYEGECYREWSYDRVDVKRRIFETSVPAQFDHQMDRITLTGFSDWSKVVGWADTLYAIDPEDEAVARIAQQCRDAEPEAPELAAIAYAQERVRYVAANFGEGGLRPRALQTICSRRWGDCKDKALLLAALLRRLGHSAQVALVNTHRPLGPTVAAPHPSAFNHVIVHTKINGTVCWIDATVTGQVGPIVRRGRPHDCAALVIDLANSELTIVPPLGSEHFGEVTRSIHDLRAGHGEPVVVTYESRYFGRDAEAQRLHLRVAGREAVARGLLEWECTLLGTAERVGELEVQDDIENNVVIFNSVIRFASPWIVSGKGTSIYRYPLCSLNTLLPTRVSSGRVLPVIVEEHPLRHLHREDFLLPPGPLPCGTDLERRSVENTAFSASRSASTENDSFVVIADTVTRGAFVAAKDALSARRDEALLPVINLVELEFSI